MLTLVAPHHLLATLFRGLADPARLSCLLALRRKRVEDRRVPAPAVPTEEAPTQFA